MSQFTRTRSERRDEDEPLARHLRNVREGEGALPHDAVDGHLDQADHPAGERHVPLFDRGVADELRAQWSDIQTAFVDDPRSAVEEANRLVGEVTDRLNETFMQNRNELERQWAAGEQASTEELRQALQRYRSFFQRLLTI